MTLTLALLQLAEESTAYGQTPYFGYIITILMIYGVSMIVMGIFTAAGLTWIDLLGADSTDTDTKSEPQTPTERVQEQYATTDMAEQEFERKIERALKEERQEHD